MDEINAQLIAQMMEEDESRILAEQLSNQNFGGAVGSMQQPS